MGTSARARAATTAPWTLLTSSPTKTAGQRREVLERIFFRLQGRSRAPGGARLLPVLFWPTMERPRAKVS